MFPLRFWNRPWSWQSSKTKRGAFQSKPLTKPAAWLRRWKKEPPWMKRPWSRTDWRRRPWLPTAPGCGFSSFPPLPRPGRRSSCWKSWAQKRSPTCMCRRTTPAKRLLRNKTRRYLDKTPCGEMSPQGAAFSARPPATGPFQGVGGFQFQSAAL